MCSRKLSLHKVFTHHRGGNSVETQRYHPHQSKTIKSGTKREHVPLESLRRARVIAVTHHEEILDK